MPKLSAKDRRKIFHDTDTSETDDVWICEVCGETDEIEGLAVYEINRITRNVKEREACMCATCAKRIPHGRVISV